MRLRKWMNDPVDPDFVKGVLAVSAALVVGLILVLALFVK